MSREWGRGERTFHKQISPKPENCATFPCDTICTERLSAEAYNRNGEGSETNGGHTDSAVDEKLKVAHYYFGCLDKYEMVRGS